MARKTKAEKHLYLRGKTWWLKYQVNGVPVYKSLETGDKQEAIRKRDLELAPISVGNASTKARVLANRAADLDTQLAKAKEAARPRLPLADVWARYPYNVTSPRRGTCRPLSPRNIKENEHTWNKFVSWMTRYHPDAINMEDVTPKHVAEFSTWMLTPPPPVKEEKEVEPEAETKRKKRKKKKAKKKREKGRGLTAGRHNQVISICRVMFRRAGLPDPFVDVLRHEARHEGRTDLDDEELRNICQGTTGELRRLLCIGLYTGMRLGDCVSLKWANLRDGKIFKIGKDRTKKTGKELVFPVHSVLSAVLFEVPEAERTGYVCPELAKKYLGDPAAEGPKKRGDPSSISKLVRLHFEKCKVKTRETMPGRARSVSRAGFHALRHSFVSICAKGGVPLDIVKNWIGHTSVQVTEIYRHFAPNEGHDKILKALDVLNPIPALPADGSPTPVKEITPAPQAPPATQAPQLPAPATGEVAITINVPQGSRRLALLQVLARGIDETEAEMLLSDLSGMRGRG